MSAKPVSGQWVGPFTTPLKFIRPEVKGFLGIPRDKVGEPGWGQPYKDVNGRPITPGTKGGPNQAASLSKKDNRWKRRRDKRIQQFGEISWRGKKKSDKADASRYILSFHGPASRHFPTSFAYGSDSRHRNVYMEGGLVGVCPGPVLGACLQSISNKQYLIAVCQGEGGEMVLRRPLAPPVYSTKEQAIAALAEFATEDNPKGWKAIGTVTITEYDPPQTPWFFNESGTEAQCIRQKSKDGTFNGVTRAEKAGDRFKILVPGGASVSTVPLENDPPYKFKESGEVKYLGEWESPPYNGYVHYWDEALLELHATCTGEQVVAVDYEGDAEVLVRAVVDVDHALYRDYMAGTDTSRHRPGYTPDPAYENDNMTPLWARYANPYEIGIDPDKDYGNHEGKMWWGGHGTWVYLKFTVEGVEYRITIESSGLMTATDYNKLPPNPEDKTAFFRFYEIQYIRHLDVRAGGMVVTRLEKFEEMLDQETATKVAGETVDTNFADNEMDDILVGEEEHEALVAKYHKRLDWREYGSASDFTWYLLMASIPGAVGGSTFEWWWDEPWPRDDEEYKQYVGAGWWDIWNTGYPPGEGPYPQPWAPGPWEWEADTYIGARPKDNDECEIGNIPIFHIWPEQSELHRKGWYGLKLLFHDKHTESACYCLREDKTYILGGELPHPDTGDPTVILKTKPSDLAAKIDGATYYPIGEL